MLHVVSYTVLHVVSYIVLHVVSYTVLHVVSYIVLHSFSYTVLHVVSYTVLHVVSYNEMMPQPERVVHIVESASKTVGKTGGAFATKSWKESAMKVDIMGYVTNMELKSVQLVSVH